MKTSNKILLGGLATATLAFLILAFTTRMNIVPVEEIEASGVSVTETRDVQPFSEIRVRTPNVKVVTQNGLANCVITGDKNVVPLIKTRMDGDKLIIEHDKEKPFRFRAPVTLTLTSDNWKSIVVTGNDLETVDTIVADYFELESNGAGNVNVKLNAKKLETKIRGASNVYLNGQAENAEISVVGAGEFRGENFFVQNAEVTLNGSSEVFINVEKFLDADVSGAGTVHYSGDPEIRKSTSGAGSVRKMN